VGQTIKTISHLPGSLAWMGDTETRSQKRDV